MKHAAPLFLLACLLCSIQFCGATITVTSVNVTTSTCPNNGTATIHATSTRDSAVFLYNVVSGPVITLQQNDSTFSSLYPGNYVAWVHDINSYDSTQVGFTIVGNYRLPVFNPIPIVPFCAGGNNCKIIANPNTSTGLSPYTWQIISPDTTFPQLSDTFSGLPAGNYTIKIMDACNNAVTQAVTVDSGGTGLVIGLPALNFIGCDTAVLTQPFYLNRLYRNFPIKLTIITNVGSIVKYETPVADSAAYPYSVITDTIYNIGFGDYLKICITDTCNVTKCLSIDSVGPFWFSLNFQPVVNNCVEDYAANIAFENDINIPTGSYALPLRFTLTDTVSHLIVDSFVFSEDCPSCPVLTSPQPGGRVYRAEITDNCGDIFQQTVLWPFPPTVWVGGVNTVPSGCLDSTGIYRVDWTGFKSALTIVLLSGPPRAKSTKPGFSYSDTIVYPIVFSNVPNRGFYIIGDLPQGDYTFEIFDSCADTVHSSFYVSNLFISSLNADYSVTKGCGNLSNISVQPGNGYAYFFMTVTEVGSNTYTIWQGEGSDPFLLTGLGAGTYFLNMDFFHNSVSANIPVLTACWSQIDTIIIQPESDSTLKTTDVAACNGTIYIHVEVDSNNGVLPFQYEILTGPEIISPQDSNTFTVHTYGTYVIGVIDSCGNVDTRQITIDTGRFDPVVKSGGWCAGSVVQLADVASPYFSYLWKKPDGGTFTGDTLIINPFTNADTGIYQITKIVSINGCQDSAFGRYYLTFKDTFQQSSSICPGDTFYVANYALTRAGVYYDTLSGAFGCDSVVITALTVFSLPVAAIRPIYPPTCHTSPITLTATGGTGYRWSNSAATDVVTVSPNTITTYTVTVTDSSNCSATASAVVYPATHDSVQQTKSFCFGDTLYEGTHAYTQTGNYTDTLTGLFGCDSFVYTALTVHLLPTAAIAPPNTPTCHTSPITLTATGGTGYKWSNTANSETIVVNPTITTTYTVTVTDTSLCSATASITVYPISDTAISLSPNQVSICSGDTATICAPYSFSSYRWNNGDSTNCLTTTKPGNYAVTVTNSLGCTAISDTAKVVVFSAVTPVIITTKGDSLIINNHYATYQWYESNTPLAGDTSSNLVTNSPGTYTVQVTDSNGCTATSNLLVLTAIKNISVTGTINVYPNPNYNGTWQVEVSPQLVGSTCQVFYAEGKLVYGATIKSAQSTVSIKAAPGMYVMQISSATATYNIKLVQF